MGYPSSWGSPPVDDPMVRHRSTSERDVGSSLISLGGFVSHRSYGRSCKSRGLRPLHHVTLVSSTLPVGECAPRLRLSFKQYSFYLIARALRGLSYSALGDPPRYQHATVPLPFSE